MTPGTPGSDAGRAYTLSTGQTWAMSVGPESLAVQNLEFGVDQLSVGKAKKFGELVHQVMFIFVHFAVDIDDLPQPFDQFFFFGDAVARH